MSKKDYRQGMADAMESYVPFGEKQEAAIRHVGDQVKQTADKVDKLGGKIGDLVDYISDREKAALYKLNTPVDIADLDDAEKRILLAVLYQLSADEESTTAEQQSYVRAVQQYLKIYNPQTMIDLETVENIEDISTQKAVLQASLEFFYLGTHPRTYTEEQMDFLDYFQVNSKTRKEIVAYIEAIIEVVGIQGLAEKYGIVAEQPRSEFATYNDNGPIPEKVADLCLAYIKNGFNQFQNGEYVLETKDYLVLCKKPSWDSWETLEKDNKLTDSGFFCIEKRSGKVARIAIDYKKDFPFTSVENLSFCIQENTVYFIENCADRTKYPEVHLVSIDFTNKEFQRQPFKFSIGAYNVPVRFHISCSKAYVMIYAYLLMDFNCTYRKDADRPLSKIFVMDLAQGNRVFTLEPDLIVRDAFIHENQFILLGATKDGVGSFFRFDIRHKTVENILPEYAHSIGGVMWDLHTNTYHEWMNDYCNAYIVEKLWKHENKWHFVYREERLRSYPDVVRTLCYPCFMKNLPQYSTLKKIFSVSGNPIILSGNVALSWQKIDPPCYDLKHYDFSAKVTSYQDKGADEYLLLGDYLYRRVKTEWYKTNISQGWDSLQWEYVIV